MLKTVNSDSVPNDAKLFMAKTSYVIPETGDRVEAYEIKQARASLKK